MVKRFLLFGLRHAKQIIQGCGPEVWDNREWTRIDAKGIGLKRSEFVSIGVHKRLKGFSCSACATPNKLFKVAARKFGTTANGHE